MKIPVLMKNKGTNCHKPMSTICTYSQPIQSHGQYDCLLSQVPHHHHPSPKLRLSIVLHSKFAVYTLISSNDYSITKIDKS